MLKNIRTKDFRARIFKAHRKDNKTRYYYYCKNTVTPTGHDCTFRNNIEQTELNRMVADIISAMVKEPRFSEAIKEKIGTAADTAEIEKHLEALQTKLHKTFGVKSRLERQIDDLDLDDPYYVRKVLDIQRRYGEQYEKNEEFEIQILNVQEQINSIRQEKISGDSIYQLLLAFDEIYNSATEIEQKEFMKAFIEKIELFPKKQENGCWIKNIVFNFLVPVGGKELKELPLEYITTLECVVLMSRVEKQACERALISRSL